MSLNPSPFWTTIGALVGHSSGSAWKARRAAWRTQGDLHRAEARRRRGGVFSGLFGMFWGLFWLSFGLYIVFGGPEARRSLGTLVRQIAGLFGILVQAAIDWLRQLGGSVQ